MAPQNTQPKSIVLANNDIVYLWWTYPHRIPNCLGFSIHRVIDGIEEPHGLQASVGFSATADPRKQPQTTDEWPIQSFNWKDVYAPRDQPLSYRIIPMIMNGDDWQHLVQDRDKMIETDIVSSTQQFGDARIVFNRGFLSTQAFSKRTKKVVKVKAENLMQEGGAKGLISKVGGIWRKRLAGQVLTNIHTFFKQKGKFYCALYELSDEELIDILLKCNAAEIILSSSESNEESRKKLHEAMEADTKLKVYDRFMKDGSIGHNKFVVCTDEHGTPQSVLTGSINWTSTGLCGQTNNLVIIHDAAIAAQYLRYWERLRDDIGPESIAEQNQELRTWCRENGSEFPVDARPSVKLWYSPNTVKRTKPSQITPASTPIDVQEVFALIANAKKQILYLVFNPGTPSIIDAVKEAALTAKTSGKPIFVRGAVSDAVLGKRVTTNIISKDATLEPDTYKVTGVAAIPGSFSYWEQEMLKLGFATIHDKILVIDPFDAENCVVVTGSHNLGFKASYANDENMLIFKGNTPIAQAYAAHVLDVVNHFKWRYKLQNRVGEKKGAALQTALTSAWHDLSETDAWMDYYYDADGDLEKEQLLF